MDLPADRTDFARTLMTLLIIGGLIAGCFIVLSPFLLPLIWAVAIVVATWPVMIGLQRRCGGRRGIAVGILTVALLMLLIVPLTLVVVTIVDHVDDLARVVSRVAHYASLPPPDWLGRLPGGDQLIAGWQQFAAMSPAELQEKITPYASRVAGWLLDEAGSITLLVVQFLVTVALCAVLYFSGENAARFIRRFAHRLAGEHGDNAAVLAAQAVRAVALGVVVTAIAQALLTGFGLLVTGIPFSGLLTALVLVLCIAQIGVFPVLVPAVVWLFWSGDTGWGIFLAIWTAFAGTMDGFLRPWLIKRGADLPILLILAGVIGGLLSLGVIGLFVGPVLLAVSYRLLEAWIGGGEGASGGSPIRATIHNQDP